MAKKKVKNRRPSAVWKKYKIEGNLIKREKSCPKCGTGYFLADMKNRFYCGRCKYVEMKSLEKK